MEDVRRGQSTVHRNLSDYEGWYTVRGTDIHLANAGDPPAQWTTTVCTSCELPSVWRSDDLVFPGAVTSVPPHPDMPTTARTLYEEAALVLPHSRRAAAALARAALESFLKSQDASGSRKNLQVRIGELDGRINLGLWKVLTALRIVGNDSLHDEADDLVVLYLSDEQFDPAELLFGALNALVEELITQPRKADALYQMIPEAKREAAERAR